MFARTAFGRFFSSVHRTSPFGYTNESPIDHASEIAKTPNTGEPGTWYTPPRWANAVCTEVTVTRSAPFLIPRRMPPLEFAGSEI